MKRVALAFVVLLAALAGACAPKVTPPAAVGGLRYPDYVFPAPPENLGDARTRTRHEAAWSRLQNGDLSGAESGFAQVVKQQPAFYPSAVGLGYALLAQGKAKDALVRFDRAVGQAPRYGPALAGRGEALLSAGQRDAALAAFEAALAADATLPDLRRRIDALKFGRVQEHIAAAKKASDAGRFDDARDEYAAAIALSPDSAFLYRDLGLVELRRKNLQEAERNLRKALALDASDARAHVGLADVLEGRGNLDDAITVLERVYAIEPSDALKLRLDRLRERSHTSGLPADYAAIPRLSQVTRGDLAALVGVRLRAILSAAPSRSSAVATDVRGHWASRWIVEVIRAGVMDVFPNHTFQPKAVIRRSDLAQAASRVLTLTGTGPSRADRNRVTVADVGQDHLSYADIAAAVASGLMNLDGGSFRPARAVTGQEAVDVVGRLERLTARGRGGSR
jgi:tetratricopeptide (TPR) repeat protein